MESARVIFFAGLVMFPAASCGGNDPRPGGSESRDAGVADVSESLDAFEADAGQDVEVGDEVGEGCLTEPEVAAAPWRPAEAGPVFVGTASRVLEVPIGTPLGAYGDRMEVLGADLSRVDGRQSPVATAFVPSVGVQSAPRVQALALQAGEVVLVLVKLDLGVGHEAFVYELEARLADEVEGGLRGRVLVTVSHTHSGWGAYNPSFSMFLGFDRFQSFVYDAIIDAAEAVAREALRSREPARLGVGIFEGWDPEAQVLIDRRPSNDGLIGEGGEAVGETRDERLSVVRIDRADGSPLAVLASFAIHGTIGREGSALASIEGPGHLELELSERLGSEVMALHLLSAAGDAGPGGVRNALPCEAPPCADYARMESIGELTAPVVLDLRASVPTSAEAELVVVTRTVSVRRDMSVRGGALSYTPFDPSRIPDRVLFDESGAVIAPIDEFNVPVGAALCGESSPILPLGQIEGTRDLVPYGSCVEVTTAAQTLSGLFDVPAPTLPLCEATRTVVTAVRLAGIPVATKASPESPVEVTEDDALLILTVPGEPVSMWDEALRARSPLGPARTLVLGYTQDYIGYVLQPEDWLTGGFEPSLNVWGPLEGEYLMEQILDVAALAASDTPDEAPQPPRLDWRQEPTPSPEPRPGLSPGNVPESLAEHLVGPFGPAPGQAQPVEVIRRVADTASFVFEGLDPLYGTPLAVLEVEREGVFGAVVSAIGRPMDSTAPEILLTYTPDPLRGEGPIRHMYTVSWQAVDDLGTPLEGVAGVEAGAYRFRVVGQGFEVVSRPFEVVGEGALRVDVALEAGAISGWIGFEVVGGYRLLRLDGPSNGMVPARGPVRVTITSEADGDAVIFDSVALSKGELTPVALELDASEGLSVDVEDGDGNTGRASIP